MFEFLETLGNHVVAEVQCEKPRVNMSDYLLFVNMTDYDYDMKLSEREKGHLDLMAKIKTFTFTTFYVVCFIVGLVGNGLVIYLILRIKKLQSITSLFLMSLSTADLLLILICVPIKVIEFLTNQWVFGNLMCKLFHYLHTFTAICSVMNLMAMSLERYFAIIHPLKAKIRTTYRRAKITIFFIWLISFFAAMPILMGKKISQVGLVAVDVCLRVWCPTAWKVFEIYRTLLLLVLPFGIMGFCYIRISMELYRMPVLRKKNPKKSISEEKKASKTVDIESTENLTMQTEVSRQSSDGPLLKTKLGPNIMTGKSISFRSHSDDEATRRQIIRILMSIVGIFFICWAPLTINNLLLAFEIVPKLNIGIHWYLRIMFHLLAYVNSCVNPIVYGFMSKKFREAFKKSFCQESLDNMYVSIEMKSQIDSNKPKVKANN